MNKKEVIKNLIYADKIFKRCDYEAQRIYLNDLLNTIDEINGDLNFDLNINPRPLNKNNLILLKDFIFKVCERPINIETQNFLSIIINHIISNNNNSIVGTSLLIYLMDTMYTFKNNFTVDEYNQLLIELRKINGLRQYIGLFENNNNSKLNGASIISRVNSINSKNDRRSNGSIVSTTPLGVSKPPPPTSPPPPAATPVAAPTTPSLPAGLLQNIEKHKKQLKNISKNNQINNLPNNQKKIINSINSTPNENTRENVNKWIVNLKKKIITKLDNDKKYFQVLNKGLKEKLGDLNDDKDKTNNFYLYSKKVFENLKKFIQDIQAKTKKSNKYLALIEKRFSVNPEEFYLFEDVVSNEKLDENNKGQPA